ncbi:MULTISPECIES: GNAT family N-acetyltransferase [Cytobacillus]|uniref:GNAT family N-acetyltransferase n=1 Tax=Cytobacillus stercorigallinarum TaxID=2762240 RepID=A0ABR8QTL9_9BACI|nr:GNAT family N-acetyltransferase [Cytobacillus stercorigallinarum]MBD7938881.1 GNAT family N-acetyltransferase [Cytobacillus stercorigallinarum]
MEIRKPTEKEVESILKLSVQSVYEGTLNRSKPEERKLREMVQSIRRNGGEYLVAVEDEEIMGWVLLGGKRDEMTEQEIGFIYELYVQESNRGKGLGRQLMMAAMKELRKLQFKEFRLTAYHGNPAIGLYESLGFQPRNISMEWKE